MRSDSKISSCSSRFVSTFFARFVFLVTDFATIEIRWGGGQQVFETAFSCQVSAKVQGQAWLSSKRRKSNQNRGVRQ